MTCWAWCRMLVMPAPWRSRQEDPWASLPSQPSLLGEFRVKVRYSFSKPKVGSDWGRHSRWTSGLHMYLSFLHPCMHITHTGPPHITWTWTHTYFQLHAVACAWLHDMLQPGHEIWPLCHEQISALSLFPVKITLKVQIKGANNALPSAS